MAQTDFFCVLDIGGTKIRSAFWDGAFLSSIESIETPKTSVADFLRLVNKHLKEKIKGRTIRGLGVSSAGPIDFVKGEVLNPANLGNGDPSWRNLNLKKGLLPSSGLKITVDNDAVMSVFGQYHHIEKTKLKDLLVITIGTGVGVGAMISGELVRAGQNMHPELGHFIVSDGPDNNYQTPFANFPTIESYLSGFHFSKRVGRELGMELSGYDLIERSKLADGTFDSMWDSYARRMAVCYCNLYLAYFPRKIVLAGGFVQGASPYFFSQSLEWTAKLLKERTDAGMSLPEVEVSKIYNDLPLLGAAYKIQLES